MTSNIGMEYINLKKAQYNREKKQQRAVAAAQPKASAVQKTAAPARASSVRMTSSAPYAAKHRPAYAATHTRVKASTVAGRGSAVGDTGSLWGDIASDIGATLARKSREAAKARACETKYVKKSVKAAKPFPITAIGYTVVFAAIAMYLVLGNSKINEATLRANSLKSAIAVEAERAEKLSGALNQRKDIGYIEDYAENVLGMVKSTDVAKHYVSVSGEDKISVRGVTVTGEQTPNAENETPVNG